MRRRYLTSEVPLQMYCWLLTHSRQHRKAAHVGGEGHLLSPSAPLASTAQARPHLVAQDREGYEPRLHQEGYETRSFREGRGDTWRPWWSQLGLVCLILLRTTPRSPQENSLRFLRKTASHFSGIVGRFLKKSLSSPSPWPTRSPSQPGFRVEG